MKQIAIVVFAIVCLTTAHAQQKSGVEFGFGVDGGVPVRNALKPYSKAGVGGDADLGYNFNPHYALLLRGGYMAFIADKEYRADGIRTVGDGTMKLVGRYTFTNRLYVEPQIGFSRFSNTGRGRKYNVKSEGFTYGAAAGFYLDPLKSFNVSIRYEGSSNSNGLDFVGVRLAYSIKQGTYL